MAAVLCAGALIAAAAQTPSPHAEAAPDPNSGRLFVDVTDVTGKPLPSRVDIISGETGRRVAIPGQDGQAELLLPAGAYTAYVYVYDSDVPVLVSIAPVSITRGKTSLLPVNVLEGTHSERRLRDFDQDFDLVLDRVEVEQGTSPRDATSVPGAKVYTWPAQSFGGKQQWYRGELHAHSKYGAGSESVKELVRRAENGQLDFLAIADRNTLAPALDPDFKSKSVVLIPAMEWGSDERGVALIYAPRTFPEMTENENHAQAICLRVQAEGGIFAIAHPCFVTAPWQWGLRDVNAVEAWCRDWRNVPPLSPKQLRADTLTRNEQGKYTSPIAFAAATQGLSGNGQGTLFWDTELNLGQKAAVIAGSKTASARVKMGAPLTYVFATEKSLEGILLGLRLGRTFVSNGPDGPRVIMWVDWNDDGTMDQGIGGFLPLRTRTRFFVHVEGAMGKRLEILRNGRPQLWTEIESNNLYVGFVEMTETYAIYRARVVEKPSKAGFGHLDVLAMTSPIYAQEIVFVGERGEEDAWVEIPGSRADAGEAWAPPIDPSQYRELKLDQR